MADDLFDAPCPVSLAPLFQAHELSGATDPFATACAQAALGCDAGLVPYNISASRLRAAIVFAPEVALRKAVAMLPLCGVGFQNALGALAPPEVAVHLTWDGIIRVNGALCGRLRMAASGDDPDTVPDWLVVGVDLNLRPEEGLDPGYSPDQTSLYLEGCGAVDAARLLEAWVRHTLVWINRLESDGPKPLHAEWRGLVEEIGQDVTRDLSGKTFSGRFLGVDEEFGMLIRNDSESHVVPLTDLLENGVKT